jgi:hypothetical protein
LGTIGGAAGRQHAAWALGWQAFRPEVGIHCGMCVQQSAHHQAYLKGLGALPGALELNVGAITGAGRSKLGASATSSKSQPPKTRFSHDSAPPGPETRHRGSSYDVKTLWVCKTQVTRPLDRPVLLHLVIFSPPLLGCPPRSMLLCSKGITSPHLAAKLGTHAAHRVHAPLSYSFAAAHRHRVVQCYCTL